MLLKKVIVRNFKSIQNMELLTDERCQIFIGKTESGKSNILEAISYIDKDKLPKKSCKRQILEGEKEENYDIKFEMCLMDEEVDIILDKLQEDTNIDVYDELKIITYNNKKLSIKEYIKELIPLYVVDFSEETKLIKRYIYTENQRDKLNIDIYTFKSEIKDILDGENVIDFSTYKLISLKGYNINEKEKNDKLNKLKFKDFYWKMHDYIKEMMINNLPSVLYWKYDDKNILPPQVKIDEFMKDNNTCLPLKTMFELAMISNISEELQEKIELGANRIASLLNRVSETATKHFNSVWPKNKVKFELAYTGEHIRISIKDEENLYDMSDRSDGFKRFVTFLLFISMNNKNGNLVNNIIIIDEPEVHIDITGQLHLRDEFLKISENNLIIFSTHSIFMIDESKVSRHFIVTKEKEKTMIKQATDSNYQESEVLFNALGYSIFKILKDMNFIFEGFKDKILFNKAIHTVKKHQLKLKNVGIGYIRGVKEAKHIDSIMQLAERNYYILSDSDNIAKQLKDEYKKENTVGKWFMYSDILNDENIIAVTSEDFINKTAFEKPISEIAKKYNVEKLNIDELDSPIGGKLYRIDNWIAQFEKNKENRKKEIESLKDYVFENLKSTHILTSYYKYIDNLFIQYEKDMKLSK
jgi:predicted ATP-dependent endonuclease of OLD family